MQHAVGEIPQVSEEADSDQRHQGVDQAEGEKHGRRNHQVFRCGVVGFKEEPSGSGEYRF